MSFNLNLIYFFLLNILIFPSVTISADPHRISLNHTEGKWLDNSEGYTSLTLFSPLPYFEATPYMTFMDVRGHFFNNGKIAANAGIGLRYQAKVDSPIYGINAFYDYREAFWNHNFHQLGIGFEYLSSCFDFRLNGYLPICDSIANSSTTVFRYQGGYRATTKDQRASYGGADFEIGKRLKQHEFCDLYGAIGAYYYAARDHKRNDYGSMGRLEARFLNYFTFEIKGGFDAIHQTQAQTTLSCQIPLDLIFECLLAPTCNDNLYTPVNRQEIIALSKKQCVWTWNWNAPSIPCCD